jgi:hypothetical protein
LDEPDNAAKLEASLRNWRRHHERLHEATRGLAAVLRQRTWQVMAADVGTVIE